MPKAMTIDKLLSLKRTLGLVKSTSSISSIYKVPKGLRRLKAEAYSPQIISIGPYHHGEENLQDMHKLQYVLRLLHRTETPVETLDDCGKAIQNLEPRVRECYAEDTKLPHPNELLEILVVDGCFIIELFYRHVIEPNMNLDRPIANNDGMVSGLKDDLLQLENQIPFFILVALYDIFDRRLKISPKRSLTSVALSFFHAEMVEDERVPKEAHHLLDLLHKFWLPRGTRKFDKHTNGSGTGKFHLSASDLMNAGIRFENNERRHLLNIEFDGINGVIKIPPLSIHETDSLLRNFIALEQCLFANNCDSTFHISSYARVMGSLIRSPEDARLLQKKGIIISDEERGGKDWIVIRGMCENVVISGHSYFDELCNNVKKYCESKWHCRRHKAVCTFRCHKYLAQLKHDYFPNPWKTIAFLAALVLLILTGLQTFYTVRSYYPH